MRDEKYYLTGRALLNNVKAKVGEKQSEQLLNQCRSRFVTDWDHKITEGNINWLALWKFSRAWENYDFRAKQLTLACWSVMIVAQHNINIIRDHLSVSDVVSAEDLPGRSRMSRHLLIAGSRLSHFEYQKACALLEELDALESLLRTYNIPPPVNLIGAREVQVYYDSHDVILKKAAQFFTVSTEKLVSNDLRRSTQRAKVYRKEIGFSVLSFVFVAGGAVFIPLVIKHIVPLWAGVIGGVVAGLALISMIIFTLSALSKAPNSLTLSSLSKHSALIKDESETSVAGNVLGKDGE